jgi:hypothetical protein
MQISKEKPFFSAVKGETFFDGELLDGERQGQPGIRTGSQTSGVGASVIQVRRPALCAATWIATYHNI